MKVTNEEVTGLFHLWAFLWSIARDIKKMLEWGRGGNEM